MKDCLRKRFLTENMYLLNRKFHGSTEPPPLLRVTCRHPFRSVMQHMYILKGQ
jgi:hypothetical protein